MKGPFSASAIRFVFMVEISLTVSFSVVICVGVLGGSRWATLPHKCFSHGFLNVSFEQQTEEGEHIHQFPVNVLNAAGSVGMLQ